MTATNEHFQVLVSCRAPDGDPATHALIKVNAKLIRYLAKRMLDAHNLNGHYDDFMGLVFDDYTPEFLDFGPNDLDAVCILMTDPALGEYDEDDFDRDTEEGFIILPRFIRTVVPDPSQALPEFVPENTSPMRPCLLYVYPDRVYWQGIPKYCDMYCPVETYSIMYDDIRKWAESFGITLPARESA